MILPNKMPATVFFKYYVSSLMFYITWNLIQTMVETIIKCILHYSDTTCTDAPKNVPIVDARGETIYKSCGYVAAEVAYLCLQEQYGGDGGLCRVACQTAGTR